MFVVLSQAIRVGSGSLEGTFMKLLTAAEPRSSSDFSFVPEGEILYNAMVVCCNSSACGCGRALSGTATPKATSIAQVSEVDIDCADLLNLAASVGQRSGWGEDAVWGSFQSIQAAIADREVGEIVRPRFEFGSEEWVYDTVLD